VVGALRTRALLASGHELRARDASGAEHPLARVLTGGIPLQARLDDRTLRLDVTAPHGVRSFAIRT
jgi:hypothetical protein